MAETACGNIANAAALAPNALAAAKKSLLDEPLIAYPPWQEAKTLQPLCHAPGPPNLLARISPIRAEKAQNATHRRVFEQNAASMR
jgi:hypothetical protein